MKTLTSSLTGIVLLGNQFWCHNKLWYRNRIKIKQLPTSPPPQTTEQLPTSPPSQTTELLSTSPPSQTTELLSTSPPPQTTEQLPTSPPPQTTKQLPASRRSQPTKLPQDLVDKIISYFARDTYTLLACSMTCYSWYIAAVPHLHYSLTTDDFHWEDEKYRWPKPLQSSYELGLLPFVKRFRIRVFNYPCAQPTIDDHTLRYFSALTNLQELGIDFLQTSDFMQDVQRYFGHLAPTLRFLALKEPQFSRREILYFIGLFPNLQDFKLCYEFLRQELEGPNDAELVPLSVPPLQGRLTLAYFTGEKFVKDMIAFFGGLRFRYMDLFKVECVRLLLGACTKTLETLRLYPTDPYVNAEAVRWHFDLSRNKSFRTLETTAESMVSEDAVPGFLRAVLSTTKSALPLNVVVIYHHLDLGWSNRPFPKPIRTVYAASGPTAEGVSLHSQRFEMLRRMYKTHAFRLVLCADVLGCVRERIIGELERIVKVEKAKGGLGYLFCEPLIISAIRSSRTRLLDAHVGYTGTEDLRASAL